MRFHAYFQRPFRGLPPERFDRESHVYGLSIEAESLEDAFRRLQAEFMTPETELRPAGVHTSFSVGDALIDENAEVYGVAFIGFTRIVPVDAAARAERFFMFINHPELIGERRYDDLFESGDGEEVVRLITTALRADAELAQRVLTAKRHLSPAMVAAARSDL